MVVKPPWVSLTSHHWGDLHRSVLEAQRSRDIPGDLCLPKYMFCYHLEASDMMLSLGGNTNLVMISRPYYKSNAELMCPLEAYRLLCEPIRYRF